MPAKEVPPPPSPSVLPSWSNDIYANAEERNWGDESVLKGQRNKNDHRWLQVYGWVLVSLTVVFATLFVLSIIFWAWHFLMPDCWGWLSPDQLAKVQSVIFSGGLGAILSTIAQKQLSK